MQLFFCVDTWMYWVALLLHVVLIWWVFSADWLKSSPMYYLLALFLLLGTVYIWAFILDRVVHTTQVFLPVYNICQNSNLVCKTVFQYIDAFDLLTTWHCILSFLCIWYLLLCCFMLATILCYHWCHSIAFAGVYNVSHFQSEFVP